MCPAISHIIGEKQIGTLGKLKIKSEKPSDLKSLIRIKKQLVLKQKVLYRRTIQVNRRTKVQLVLPPSFRTKALEGCHDQVGHLDQDKVLELLRDMFYWARDTHWCGILLIIVAPGVVRRKSQPDQAPLLNIEVNQLLELNTFGLSKNWTY